MSDNIIDMLRESHKQNIKKRKQTGLRDYETFVEIIALLEREYLCDSERYYKIIDYKNRICKQVKYTVLKNTCVNIKKPQKVDSKTVNDAINAWKSECVFISEPSLHRDDDDIESWKLESSSEISNIIIENDPRKWLDVWFDSKKIKIRSCNEFYIEGERVPFDDLFATMNCDFIANKPEKTRINLQVLKNALDLKISLEQKKIKKTITDKLSYEIDLNNNMERFIKALLGKYDFITDMILRHFIWQVKRKINGLKIFDHLMPIIYGSQGIGKSEAIKKLLSPLDGLWIEGKFSDLIDDRNSKFFESNYIMFFDEMKGATKADIEEIKERITADFIKFRLLYSHNMMRVKNNCTFIGTSNKPVSLLIRDETGMRRFYEIEVQQNCDWNTINKIDYLAIWRDVDESLDKPFIAACRDEVKAQQENNRDKNSVEQWVDERYIAHGNEKCEATAVYNDYAHFCRLSGLYVDSRRVFGIKLKSIIKITSYPQNGKRYFNLNKLITDAILHHG
jgi:hypothetical protein